MIAEEKKTQSDFVQCVIYINTRLNPLVSIKVKHWEETYPQLRCSAKI